MRFILLFVTNFSLPPLLLLRYTRLHDTNEPLRYEKNYIILREYNVQNKKQKFSIWAKREFLIFSCVIFTWAGSVVVELSKRYLVNYLVKNFCKVHRTDFLRKSSHPF